MQWHQLDHRPMQTICTSLQTDYHTNTPSLNFYRPDALPGLPDSKPTVSKHWRQFQHLAIPYERPGRIACKRIAYMRPIAIATGEVAWSFSVSLCMCVMIMCPAKTDEPIFTVSQKKGTPVFLCAQQKTGSFFWLDRNRRFFSHILRNV